MIRIVLTRRLTALTGQRDRAEARVPAVQLRLARLKNERDQLLRDFDERAVLAQEQAGKLERNLREEERRSEALAAQLRQAREDLAALRTVERWLQSTVEHYLNAAEAPVDVIVHDGVVHGVERSREAAKEAVRRVDPAVTSWSPVSPEEDLRVGWKIGTYRLPEVERPPHYAELQAHYWPEDGEAEKEPAACCADGDLDIAVMTDHLEAGDCLICPAALRAADLDVLHQVADHAQATGATRVQDLLMVELERRLTEALDGFREVTA